MPRVCSSGVNCSRMAVQLTTRLFSSRKPELLLPVTTSPFCFPWIWLLRESHRGETIQYLLLVTDLFYNIKIHSRRTHGSVLKNPDLIASTQASQFPVICNPTSSGLHGYRNSRAYTHMHTTRESVHTHVACESTCMQHMSTHTLKNNKSNYFLKIRLCDITWKNFLFKAEYIHILYTCSSVDEHWTPSTFWLACILLPWAVRAHLQLIDYQSLQDFLSRI